MADNVVPMLPVSNKFKEKADKVQSTIENAMNIMAALFGPDAKLTLIVRNPKDPDTEVPFFTTNDNKTELARIMQLHFGLVLDKPVITGQDSKRPE